MKKIKLLLTSLLATIMLLAMFSCGGGEDPCSLFRSISFPVGEFFPPNTVCLPENYDEARTCFCCR